MAWKRLEEADPDIVCKNAAVGFDTATGRYILTTCGMDFFIAPGEKLIESIASDASLLLGKLSYFFRLSVPWYLTSAKDIPLSARLVKPDNLKGGHLFFRGSHVMPLDRVAGKYARDVEGFMMKCAHFGGTPQQYGDAAFALFPFPRIPVTIILWTADEEFDARVELLLDTTCELQAPIDIIWSISMMSLLMLL
ncbi:MAG: DUF3786 domain-containing protein [Dissulfurispiraceae bacterium]